MLTELSHILAYREQQQLFLFDKAYIAVVLFKVGGFSTLVARFIVQFFWNPTMAIILTAALLVTSTCLTWIAFRRSSSDWGIIPLCVIPALLMGASICDNALHFDALISWMMCIIALAVYSRIKSGRLLWGAVITLILYFSAGPAAIIFATTTFAVDCFQGRFKSFINILVALACAFIAYGFAWVPTLRDALTPSLFYDMDTSMSLLHWAPWIAIPVVAIIGEVFKFTTSKKGSALIVACALFAASFTACISNGSKYCTAQTATLFEYEYYTVNEDWNGLIKSCKRHEWMPITANYLNMALSYNGNLCDQLFKYDQRGPMSLIMTHDQRAVDITQAHIMFAMGNFSAAQVIAFNILMSLNGLCPAMVKMNAVIELLRGSYNVADKYLTLLEKTPHYRKWAKKKRDLLWNSSSLEADPFLGPRLNDFPDNGFALYGDPMTELYHVLEQNPSDKQAMQYALSYLMLAKDMNSICLLVDRFFGSPALQELPVPVQEAILFQSEYLRNVQGINHLSEQWCLSHGVKPETFSRFNSFQQASLQNGGKAPARFRGTFWYYLTAVQI